MRPPANHQIIGHKRPAWGACPPWAAFWRAQEALVARAMFQIVGDGMGECDRRRLTPNAFGQNFGLAFGDDFFGCFSVSNASAFFNADAPDSATHDPVGAFWTFDELEHVDTS